TIIPSWLNFRLPLAFAALRFGPDFCESVMRRLAVPHFGFAITKSDLTRTRMIRVGIVFACSWSVLFSAVPTSGFLQCVHKKITEDALRRFPPSSIPDWQRASIVRGSSDADDAEGLLGPYGPRFHFDNDFGYRAVACNYAAVARLLEANRAKSEPDP